MSRELLLLLVVVVLWPLIQQLLQAARGQDPRTPERAERPPLRMPPAPTHAPPPPPRTTPPLPALAAHATSDAMTPRAAPARETSAPATLALTPHRSTRRRLSVLGLHNRLDLRRAIVLTAILGPCRAANPYDGPEGTRGQ